VKKTATNPHKEAVAGERMLFAGAGFFAQLGATVAVQS
jgi:hypothetical protein